MGESDLKYTNRVILAVSAKQAVRDLVSGLSRPASLIPMSHYLVDHSNGLDGRRAELQRVFRWIFRQQLEELAIPESIWPDVESLDQFERHFDYEYLGLDADFGTGPVRTGIVGEPGDGPTR